MGLSGNESGHRHQTALVDEVARAKYLWEDGLLACWKGQ